MHILSPETDNCPSWISRRERMTVENISWSISTKECCRPQRGWTRDLLVSSRTAHPTEPQRSLRLHQNYNKNIRKPKNRGLRDKVKMSESPKIEVCEIGSKRQKAIKSRFARWSRFRLANLDFKAFWCFYHSFDVKSSSCDLKKFIWPPVDVSGNCWAQLFKANDIIS